MGEKFTREQPRVAPLTATPILVEIEAEYVPLLFSALEKYHNRYYWVSDGDYVAGLQGVFRLERALLTDMSESIVTELQRIYRLMDTTFNGTVYEAESVGENLPPVITPALPDVPPANSTKANALRARVARLHQLVENAATAAEFGANSAMEGTVPLDFNGSWAARFVALQGTKDAGWFSPDVPVTLKDLMEAARLNSEDDRTKVRQTVSDLTEKVNTSANVADAIGEYLQTAADLGTDGGVIAVQLATSAAILLQLQKINVALNGNPSLDGPLGEPPILFALRGDEVITSSNNILTQLKGGLYEADTGQNAAALQRGANAALGTLLQYIGAGSGGSSVNGQLATIAGRLFDAGRSESAAQLLAAILGALVEGGGGETAVQLLRKLLSAKGELGQNGGPLTEREYLAAIAVAANRAADEAARAADCCEDGGGGSTDTPAPPFESSQCGPDFAEELRAGSGFTFEANTTVEDVFWDNIDSRVLQPTSVPPGSRGAFRVVEGSTTVCVQLARSTEDTGTYNVAIETVKGDGSPFPEVPGSQFYIYDANESYSFTAVAQFQGENVFYTATIVRIDTASQQPATREGLQPRLSLATASEF